MEGSIQDSHGTFQTTVMFFGMCNSPATFQAMMDSVFEDELYEGWVIIYMDDILIFSKDKETLEAHTKWILQRLRENDLYLKPQKCEFCKAKIKYLGLIIEEGRMSMDPMKLKGIQDWPTPTTVKQVWSFLGFGNFYRRFIWRFSDLAWPLNALLQKDKDFLWDKSAQHAFKDDSLKNMF